ncbi:MAG: PAS domain S-box protein [Coprothermobacterota bacterium]|nr:PAS domain S-box protein [Coprothermobacterota bacterium]
MITLKALFVEDDRVDQLAFEQFLEERGLPIAYVLAGSFNEAKCLLSQGEFDIIVADYSMGDGTALDLLPFAPGVPMILITGVGNEEIAARAFTAGICDYLVKDVGRNYLEQLPERMEKAVEQRRRSAEALQENQALYRRIVDTANEGIWIADQDYNTSFVNSRMADMLGYQPEEMVGRPIQHFLFPEDLADFAARTSARGRTAPSQYERRFRHKDGSALWTIISTTAVNEQGEFRGPFAMVTDISKRKKVEEGLRESEEKYRALVENANEVILVVQDGMLKFVNRMACKLTGYSEQELTSRPFPEFIYPDDRGVVVERYQKRLKGDAFLPRYAFRLMTRDGAIKWTEIGAVLIDWEGRPATLNFLTDITERKRVEEGLRESEERYQALFDRSLDCVYIHDFEGRFIDANDAALNLLGYTREEIRGVNFSSLLSEDQLPLALKAVQEIREAGFQRDLTEYRLRLRNGNDVYIETKGSAILSKGAYTAIQSVARNITERKRVEEALQESEEKYRAIMEQAADAVFIHDETGRILDVNRKACQSLGYSREEFLSKSIGYDDPEAIQAGRHELWGKVLAGEQFTFESREMRKDGSAIPVEVRLGSVRLPSGSVILGILRDITERKQAEESLRESEAKYRLLVENANEAIFVAQDGMLKFVNRMAIELTGYSEQELTSRPFPEFIHPDDRGMVVERHLSRLKGDVSLPRYAFRLMTRGSGIKWVEISSVLIDWEDRPATLNFLADITDRKQAEEVLRESEGRYRTLFETMTEGVVLISPDGQISHANPAAERILKLNRSEIEGRQYDGPGWELLRPDGAPIPPEEIAGTFAMGGFRPLKDVEIGFKHSDGLISWINVNAAPLLDHAGEPKGVVGTFQDITEREQLKRETAKKTTRDLTSGIAYQIRNPLFVISLSTQSIEKKLPAKDPQRRLTQAILERVHKLDEVTAAMIHLGKYRQLHITSANLHQCLEQALIMVRAPSKAQRVKVVRHYYPNLPQAWIDIEAMDEVFANLFANALEAMPEGGFLTVETSLEVERKKLLVRIQDSGCGIPKTAVERIFVPFFTTKKLGSGLGLVFCQRIVAEHGGRLTFQSEAEGESRGTTFQIALPLSRPAMGR